MTNREPVTRDSFAEFKRNPVYFKLLELLQLGYDSAIDHYLETGNDVQLAAKTYREIKSILEDPDVWVEEEATDA